MLVEIGIGVIGFAAPEGRDINSNTNSKIGMEHRRCGID